MKSHISRTERHVDYICSAPRQSSGPSDPGVAEVIDWLGCKTNNCKTKKQDAQNSSVVHQNRLQAPAPDVLCPVAPQSLDLVEVPATAAPGAEPHNPRRVLPALESLTGLTALNLADNCLQRVPQLLTALTKLQYLDLSGNGQLRAPGPITILQVGEGSSLFGFQGVEGFLGVGGRGAQV